MIRTGMRTKLALVVLSLILGGCAQAVTRQPIAQLATPSESPSPMPCRQIDPKCQAERLPDVVLTGSQTDGALDSVDGFSLEGIISSDEALKRAWEEDGQGSKTVQVVLGSADALKLHWGDQPGLYYAIEWGGVCIWPMGGPIPPPNASPTPTPTCFERTWGTVIDAHTGAFIVGGS
jgi:hypothetical protein